MAIQILKPKDELEWKKMRSNDITSTEISALFGISPYTTEFELWHRKKEGLIVDIEQSERMTWGLRLQDAIAHGIAEDNGWTVRRMDEYIRDPDLRIGASFDFSIEGDEPGLLEIKNVDSLIFRQGWELFDDESMEAPPHIELQIQHQLAVSGRSFAYLGALVGGNKLVLIKREPDQDIIESIKTRAKRFWEEMVLGLEPIPDFERDAKFLSSLYGYAEPGKVVDLTGDGLVEALANEYRDLGEQIKILERSRDAKKAQILTKIGDAEKVIGSGFSITAGVVGPAHIEYDRKGYRAFRVNWPRTKKES